MCFFSCFRVFVSLCFFVFGVSLYLFLGVILSAAKDLGVAIAVATFRAQRGITDESTPTE